MNSQATSKAGRRTLTAPSAFQLLFALLAFLLLLGFFPAGLIGQTPPPTISGNSTTLALRPGDVITVASWADPALAGDYAVDEDGRVILPVLGNREATGIPAGELRRQLREDYAARYRAEAVQVTVKRRVRILGEVREPGLYHVDPTMTLGDILAMAGGLTELGDTDDIHLLRDGEVVVDAALRAESPMTEALHSGDQIVVGERSWFSRNGAILVGALISGAVYLIAR